MRIPVRSLCVWKVEYMSYAIKKQIFTIGAFWAAEIFPSRGITQYFDLGNIQTTYRVPSHSYLHLVCLEINFPVVDICSVLLFL